MQLHTWTLALMALSNAQVASPHMVRTPLASLDDITAASLSTAQSGLQTRNSVPHDVPEHPHCTYKGKDSTMYMVFSKDFGRNDETSKNGCGSDMLHHLRKGTSSRCRTSLPPPWQLFSVLQFPCYTYKELTRRDGQNAVAGLLAGLVLVRLKANTRVLWNLRSPSRPQMPAKNASRKHSGVPRVLKGNR